MLHIYTDARSHADTFSHTPHDPLSIHKNKMLNWNEFQVWLYMYFRCVYAIEPITTKYTFGMNVDELLLVSNYSDWRLPSFSCLVAFISTSFLFFFVLFKKENWIKYKNLNSKQNNKFSALRGKSWKYYFHIFLGEKVFKTNSKIIQVSFNVL